MFHVLIDTCVWLDLAEDSKLTPLLLVVENMVRDGELELLVPRMVISEFKKNRDRVAKASAKRLSSHFQIVKAAVGKVGGPRRRTDQLLTELSNMSHKIPIVGGAAEGVLTRIETLLRNAQVIELSDGVKLAAADRALNRKAPCHHDNKNSIADAVLLETYFEAAKTKNAAGERFAFVTHNKTDFSQVNGNQKLPHTELAASFSRVKSLYFINLSECLRRINPSKVSHLMWEQSWEQEPRGLTELLKAEERLFRQVWYNRHKYLAWQIEKGKHKVVTEEDWKRKKNYQNTIVDTVWKRALASAKKTERQLGKGNFGPWDDFEWGMINGKLSAIRWMLGDEWDMLDT